MENNLEIRMYFFTVFSLNGISKGIACGHAALQYARLFSAEHPEVWDFVDNHKTWIILNGGTTNNERDFEGIPAGSMNLIADQLQENDIMFSYFIEPDQNNALNALCFLADERVFNKKDYPDFPIWITEQNIEKEEDIESLSAITLDTSIDECECIFPEYYKLWVRSLGGVKNVFLRELIRNKKLA